MMAFVPNRWEAYKRVTPQWLIERPLIFNDSTTHMYRLTTGWFAAAGLGPRAQIKLNATEAMKSLVAAGYGAAVLPLEQPMPSNFSDKVQVSPLRPALTRYTGVAHRSLAATDGATRTVLETLARFRQK